MDNLTELKAIWQNANTESLLDAAEMLKEIQKFRSQRMRKKWTVIVFASLLTLLMITVLLSGHFNFVSTYIGGMLIASSGLLLAITNILSLKRFSQLENCSNKEFLDFVEQTRLNQIHYFKRTQVMMMILCSIGLMFYLYEPATAHLFSTMVVLIITVAFLLFCWLFVRPRVFKRNHKKLEELRTHLENISNQLN